MNTLDNTLKNALMIRHIKKNILFSSLSWLDNQKHKTLLFELICQCESPLTKELISVIRIVQPEFRKCLLTAW